MPLFYPALKISQLAGQCSPSNFLKIFGFTRSSCICKPHTMPFSRISVWSLAFLCGKCPSVPKKIFFCFLGRYPAGCVAGLTRYSRFTRWQTMLIFSVCAFFPVDLRPSIHQRFPNWNLTKHCKILTSIPFYLHPFDILRQKHAAGISAMAQQLWCKMLCFMKGISLRQKSKPRRGHCFSFFS